MKDTGQITGLFVALSLTLMLSLPLAGCCEKTDLRFDRFEGFISGVGDIHAGFSFDWLSGNLARSLELWTGIRAFSSEDIFSVLNMDFEFGANATFEAGRTLWDVDNDAFREPVRVLLVTNQDTGEEFRFFQWNGDDYTLDSGQTYVGWVTADSTVIVAANAKGSEGVVIVEMSSGGRGRMGILACTDSYQCGTCDENDKLSSCISIAEEGRFTPVVSSNESTDSDPVQSGTDTDTDSATGSDDTSTSGNTDTGSSFTVNLDSDSDIDISINIDSDTITIGWDF